MALSNIVREPRREITESAVGIALVAAFVAGDYWFSLWLQNAMGGWSYCPWPLGMWAGVALALGLVLVTVITHAIGEEVCDALQRRGVHLRPRQRCN